MPKKNVLLVGLEPKTIDYSGMDYQPFSKLGPELVQAGLDADVEKLTRKGIDAELCLDAAADLPATLEIRLRDKTYDCILVGAGVRLVPKNFLLFERVINIIHMLAPKAVICFNTKPDDSMEAVGRWLAIEA